MKSILISFIIFISGTFAHAIPVMDTATGTAAVLLVTVVPDSVDKNLYYFFPTNWGVARNSKTGKPAFSYVEFSTGWFSSEASVSAAFGAESSPDLMAKAKEILRDNPAAKFTPIPIISARYVPHKNFARWIQDVECFEKGNTVGQIVGCTWKVNVDSERTFYKVAKGTGTVQILEYNYTFGASVNGKYMEISQSAAFYLDGIEHADFWDSKGRRLN